MVVVVLVSALATLENTATVGSYRLRGLCAVVRVRLAVYFRCRRIREIDNDDV